MLLKRPSIAGRLRVIARRRLQVTRLQVTRLQVMRLRVTRLQAMRLQARRLIVAPGAVG